MSAAEAEARERTETLQRVERPLQSRRQLQAAVASLRELTRQAPPAEGPGSSCDRNGLLAPLYLLEPATVRIQLSSDAGRDSVLAVARRG
eukprot:COSAG01_NODE_1409_length_10417_cov_4.920043_1_plen_89_part_10